MFTGDINSGVGGDIRQATSLARRMITEWGMNERLGFVFYGEDEQQDERVRLRRRQGILRGDGARSSMKK